MNKNEEKLEKNSSVNGMALGYFAIMFFATSILMMILTVILGILNKNRITNQTLKKKINKMLWVLGIGHAIVIFLFVWMF